MSGFPSVSRVQICGVSKHECGYCKDATAGDEKANDSSISYGFVAKAMAVEDYQSLMLTGWRRSGTYFYKPIMHKTCCPQYTIRLRVNDFRSSKSQKKVMKTVATFLADVQDDSTFSTEEDLKISSMFTFTSAMVPSDAQSAPTTPSNRGPRKLTVDLEPSSFSAEKFELYKRYQTDVHHDKPDEVTEQGFRRFLVDSPLKDNNPQYGSFHQLYRLNGVLIAVGVVDLLPLGLSSVYMFYDNNYKHLSLGKYTALREIEYCKSKALEYYFMGFYIHTCEKMRYKGEYKPSELLCPTSLQWYPLNPYCSEILDKFHFSPFEPALAAKRAAIDVDVGVRKSRKTDASGSSVGSDVNGATTTNANAITESVSTATATEGVPENSDTISEENVKADETDTMQSEDENEEEEEEGDGSDTELEPSLLDEFAPMYFNNNTSSNLNSSTDTTIGSTTTTSTTTSTSAATTSDLSAAIATALCTVPLDIGVARPIKLTDLRAESVTHLQPFLQEWIAYVGPVNGAKITVSLV
eukprot:gene11353-13204_t